MHATSQASASDVAPTQHGARAYHDGLYSPSEEVVLCEQGCGAPVGSSAFDP